MLETRNRRASNSTMDNIDRSEHPGMVLPGLVSYIDIHTRTNPINPHSVAIGLFASNQ